MWMPGCGNRGTGQSHIDFRNPHASATTVMQCNVYHQTMMIPPYRNFTGNKQHPLRYPFWLYPSRTLFIADCAELSLWIKFFTVSSQQQSQASNGLKYMPRQGTRRHGCHKVPGLQTVAAVCPGGKVASALRRGPADPGGGMGWSANNWQDRSCPPEQKHTWSAWRRAWERWPHPPDKFQSEIDRQTSCPLRRGYTPLACWGYRR